LALSLDGNLTQEQVFNILTYTADKVGGYSYVNEWSEELGYGRVNAFRVVTLVNAIKNISITGPSLVCSSSSGTFILHDRPVNTNVHWEQSSNLLEDGGQSTDNYRVNATTSAAGTGWVEPSIRDCLNREIGSKTYSNFWVGTPDPTITGEQYPGCGDINWYFLDPDDMWGSYSWSVTYRLSIIGSSLGYKARIRADEEGDAIIYCDVTNTCGTNHGSLQVWVGQCFDFLMSPNPADDYVKITIDGTKMDIYNLNQFNINIIGTQNKIISQLTTSQPIIQINTSDLLKGVYIVQLIYNGKSYSKQLIISH
jgi:hypothetical protein